MKHELKVQGQCKEVKTEGQRPAWCGFLKPPLPFCEYFQPGFWVGEEYSEPIWINGLPRIFSERVIGTVALFLTRGTQYLAVSLALPCMYLAQSKSLINT